MTSRKNNQKDLKAPDEQDGSAGTGTTGPAEEARDKSGKGSAMTTTGGNKEERTQKPPSAQEVQAMRKKADVTMKEAAGHLKKGDVTGGVVQVSDEETMATSHGFVLSKVEVGRGSRAVIYKACNPSKNEIACKVTAVKNLKGIGKTRYLDSLKILRFLIKKPHVSLLATEEVFATSDKIYVFCPLMTYDLAHRMTQMSGVFTEEESLRIGRQVAEGIAFLHSLGVAHERIRPGHILFDERGVTKIGGLGWLITFYDQEKNSHVLAKGSLETKFQPFYAPEVLKNDFYDPSIADVWSLGTVIVFMQTKEWPFQKDMTHRHEVAYRVTFMKAGLKLSPVTLNIFELCFHVDAKKRADIFDVVAAFP